MTAKQAQYLKIFLMLSVVYGLMQLFFNFQGGTDATRSLTEILLKSIIYGAITTLITIKVINLK